MVRLWSRNSVLMAILLVTAGACGPTAFVRAPDYYQDTLDYGQTKPINPELVVVN